MDEMRLDTNSPTAEQEGQYSNWTPIHCRDGNSLDVLQ